MSPLMLLKQLIRRNVRAMQSGWEESTAAQYKSCIRDSSGDSAYLRDHGLKPGILSLIQGLDASNVLDAGCGDGWLFDTIRPVQGMECDVVEFLDKERSWPFSKEDITALSLESDSFDLVVASLVLMFIEDLESACGELFRVAASDADLVVAITHPVLYRLGSVLENRDVRIDHDYSEHRTIPDLYIAGKVGPFCYYHRPLCDYFNALIQVGWTIAEFREWSIDIDDYVEHCTHLKSTPIRTGRLPLYAFFRCKKDLHATNRPVGNELDS